MRRLSLAYATHGAPLSYEVTNKDALADKLVYVRVVDTSAIEPLAGSGATSNKVLVNLVNFEATPQTVIVKVKMPKQAVYEGERFGSGDTYEQARSYVTGKQASPQLMFQETLGAGEAVQYILQPTLEVVDAAPKGLKAKAVKGLSIQLNWLEASGASYEVLRADGNEGELKTIATGVKETHYTDLNLREGAQFSYAVKVSGSSKLSDRVQITATGLVPLERSEWKVSSNMKGSDPNRAIDGDVRTRWDTGADQKSGEWYQIDMGKVQSIEAIELNHLYSSYDYPRQYQVYVSNDAQNWTSIATGSGSKDLTRIAFAQVRARYIKLVQTGVDGNYWSIHELQVYFRE